MWAPVPPRTRCVARFISHTILVLLSARTLSEERKCVWQNWDFTGGVIVGFQRVLGAGWQVGNPHSPCTLP